mmetsp:Transcript_13830/g.33773  ORF Transcript_13830/g.33773 Transcript_13830/m.33773 type:complete len:89 (-) Transcript_13830:70-336(-)
MRIKRKKRICHKQVINFSSLLLQDKFRAKLLCSREGMMNQKPSCHRLSWLQLHDFYCLMHAMTTGRLNQRLDLLALLLCKHYFLAICS